MSAELVLQEVLAERQRQDGKWGQQNHEVVPPRTADFSVIVARQEYEDSADAFKGLNDMDVARGTVGWDRVLLEEVYEALAESDPRKIREELVQVAAVACAIIESLDRNELAGAR